MSKEESNGYTTKMGRCSKYIPEYNEVAGNLALAGFSDKEIAKTLNIAEQTLYNWQENYPAFKQAMLEGKEIAVGNVTRSLYRRCMGYETTEIKIEKDDCGNVHKITENVKHIPAETSAMTFFLKSKAPDKFSDKKKIEMEHTPRRLEDFYNISDSDPMEVSRKYQELMKAP